MKAEHHNKVYHITSNSYCLQSMSQRIPYFSIKQRWNKWKTCIHRSNWVSIAAKIAFRSCWLKVISTNQLHGLATRNDMMSFTLAHDDSHSSSGLQNWEQEKRNKNSQIAKRKRFRSLDSGPHSHDDFGRRPSLCHGWCKEIHWQVHCGSEAWAEGHIKMYLKKPPRFNEFFQRTQVLNLGDHPIQTSIVSSTHIFGSFDPTGGLIGSMAMVMQWETEGLGAREGRVRNTPRIAGHRPCDPAFLGLLVEIWCPSAKSLRESKECLNLEQGYQKTRDPMTPIL